jgi:hypothetical protein
MQPLRFPFAASARIAALVLASALALVPGAARAQGVATELQPAYGSVAPGAEFDVDFVVPVAGAAFNGFHAVFSYDPAALTFIQAVPVTSQQGCLMTGGCSSACGLTFPVFSAAGDSLVVDLSLLCDQVSLTGPGQLYRLHFLASNTAQITYVTTRRVQILDGGIYVNPVAHANSRIVIGAPAGVEGGASGTGALRLAAEPNPTQGPVAFSIASARDGIQSMDVLDLSGRLVRHLSAGWQPRGTRQLSWDGTDASGNRLAAGVYLVRLRVGADMVVARVAIVR